MQEFIDRFFRYVAIDTQSDERSQTHPSFPGELTLADLLKTELGSLGAETVRRTPEGYVYARFPATSGLEKCPALGLIAHLDTSDAASGKNVRPTMLCYTGGTLALGNSGRILEPGEKFIGKTLIVTDGNTLLGGDDKAGIAEIMTALTELRKNTLPHGTLCIAFTPDEEIGEGTMFFDLPGFGADCAFTVDGGDANTFSWENFNAAIATLSFHGVSVHPGSAKGKMKNALKMAMNFDALLPADEVPEKTCLREGFFHLIENTGTVSEATARYLLRDHDAEKFAERRQIILQTAEKINEKFGSGSCTAEIRDQYRNMAGVIAGCPLLTELAARAIRQAGGTPESEPIRGGTDGAMLSWKGLPCPNLGTGDYNAHGEYEFVCVEESSQMVRTLLALISEFSKLNGRKISEKAY